MPNIFNKITNTSIIVIMFLVFGLEIFISDFSIINNQLTTSIVIITALIIWLIDSSNKSNFYKNLNLMWLCLVSLFFYKYDVEQNFFLSHNAVLLAVMITNFVISLLHSRELDLLKEQISALQEQNRQFKNDKNRFHQNIQHNHNVPVGTLKNNFEIFSELFLKKIEPALINNIDSTNQRNLDMLKTSITLVQHNLDEALSYVEHVNAVSQKCKKENICDINYTNKISVLEIVSAQLKTLSEKHSNPVLFKCAESEKEIANATIFDYCNTNNEKLKLINYNIFADKIKLSEAIYQVLKNQFKYAPGYRFEIEINIFKEYDKTSS